MPPKRLRRSSRTSTAGTDSIAGSQQSVRNHNVDQHEEDELSSMPNGLAPEVADADDDPDHVKIMLATDNHIGYMERDPVRGSDSINTFREILQVARERDVDFILLGGDLFHDNKPSRTSMHQVLGALREFTLGDKPVSIELLSDPNDGKPQGYNFPAVNYEDPNLNVAIPVFSIHGNHDDPQGIGAEGALSAVDLLSVTGLCNYFGKIDLPSSDAAAKNSATQAPTQGGLSDVGIRIRPVLLRKGQTKIALYGMGNIKDERMNFELRSNRVRMYRPREDPDDWFNILTIHQNRVAHNPKAVVPEGMFDDSMHLVVWGHEHDQRIKPEPVTGKRYFISQPGSSVATSLAAGETIEKKVGIIHVKGRDFHLEEIPLKTVRPFVTADVDLDKLVEQARERIDNKQAVNKLLKREVNNLIEQANQKWEQKYADVAVDQRPQRMLPLIRLRVFYTRHEMGNLVRFGQEFSQRVANPRDLLQFSKKKAESASRKNASAREGIVEPTDDMVTSEKLEKVRMRDLVRTYLGKQNLQILDPLGLEKAVMQFVEKDERDVIGRFIDKELKLTNSNLAHSNLDEHRLDSELDRIRDSKNNEADRQRAVDQEDAEDERAIEQRRGGGRGAAGSTSAADASTSRRTTDNDGFGVPAEQVYDSLEDSDNDHLMDDGFDDEPIATPVAAPTGRRMTASTVAIRGRGNNRAAASPSRAGAAASTHRGRIGGTQTTLMFRGPQSDEEPSQPQPPPTPTSRARAAALAGPPRKTATRSPAKKTTSTSKTATGRSSGTTAGRRGTSRAAAQKANSRIAHGDGDEDSDEIQGGSDDEFEDD